MKYLGFAVRKMIKWGLSSLRQVNLLIILVNILRLFCGKNDGDEYGIIAGD